MLSLEKFIYYLLLTLCMGFVNKLILISLIAFILVGSYGCCAGCGCAEDKDDDGPDPAEDAAMATPQAPTGTGGGYPPAPTCKPSAELPDGKDNNCDGQIDEEVCGDGIDNNGNGKFDESPPC